MSNRSWFFASQGRQQGPYPEAQLVELIARGTVTADTLVWSEGMTDWQKARDVPGLVAAGSGPPAATYSSRPATAVVAALGGPISIEFGVWEFTWRSIVLLLGLVLVIPAPWVLIWYLKWIVPCVKVPGRPNLSFTGTAGTIALWYFGFIGVAIVVAILAGLIGINWINNLFNVAQLVLYWLFLKWLIANLASNEQPLGLSFSGSFWAYLGWTILAVISFVTIIGWAWAYVAWIRWFCRNIQGTRREVLFVATGLEFLWRAIVAGLAMLFIIPIPWMYRWLWQWMASQTVLAERGTHANG
jgi:hypothetical protein